MADTIISSPSRSNESGVLGWVVALIVVLAVIVAGFVWMRQGVGIPNTGSGTNINVAVPASGTDYTGNTGQ